MGWLKQTRNVFFEILLVAIVVVVQTGALTHAHEHDPGTPQTQVCATCIAANATTPGGVPEVPQWHIEPCRSHPFLFLSSPSISIQIPLARQRAPPTSL